MAGAQGTAGKGGRNVVRAALLRCVPGLVLAAAVSFFTSMATLFIPVFTMQVFERVLASHSVSTLIALTAIVLFGLLMSGFLDYSRSRILMVQGNWLSRKLGLESLEAIVTRALRGKGSPGQALRDINDLRAFLSGGRIVAVLEFFWTPLFFLVLFLLHPLYGVAALGGAVLLLAMGIVNEVVTHRTVTEANEAGVDSFSHFGSALRNAEVIEAMGLMGRIARRWYAAHDEMLRLTSVGTSRANLIRALSHTLRLSMQVGITVVGTLLVIYDKASPGSIFAAMMIMGRTLGPFEQLIDGWRQWLHAAAAYRRVRTLFEDGDAPRSTMILPRPQGRLEVDRVTFVPSGLGRPVLRGVSFQIDPGESLGILGASAAGKSTLARLIVGIWKPSAGAIRLDGQDVYLWDRENFGRYVGYLPQGVGLFEATVRENIARLEDADPLDVVTAARKADVHEVIGRLPMGYDTEISDGGFLLTGGQRQRIALARALYRNPSLLVLDEPDANLDQAGEAALVRAILQAKADGATVVVVTHRRALLEALDKLLILKDGAVDRFGDRRVILPTLPGAAAAPVSGQPMPRLAGAAAAPDRPRLTNKG